MHRRLSERLKQAFGIGAGTKTVRGGQDGCLGCRRGLPWVVCTISRPVWGLIQRRHLFGVQEWKPTSNARNTAMIKEAKRFAFELKALHRDLTALSLSTDSKKST